MKAIEFVTQAAQGDLLISRIDKLPTTNIVPVVPTNGNFVVAHSETGHHHVVACDNVQYFDAANDSGEVNEFVSYLKVEADTIIRHLRGFDTHAPIKVNPGIYRVNRQQEYTPEGLRRAQD